MEVTYTYNFMSSWSLKNSKKVDYDEEGRKLLAKLNLESGGNGEWCPLDAIYAHQSGGGKIYVGNAQAAESRELLDAHGITHIVNCTHGMGAIPCFHKNAMKYYVFPISHWHAHVKDTHESVLAFSDPMFNFIEEAISSGSSVLVHCLAGAHRAGTTGCACLMHFASLDHVTAIKTAKKLRPIIDPIGQLPQFLQRLEIAIDSRKARAAN